jgi:TolB protein
VLASASCSGSSASDEASVAFSSWDTDLNSTVYVAQPDGSDTRRVTRGWNVDATSDGGRLVFVDGIGDYGSSVYVINEDGTERERILRNANWPAWSPDGSRVAFLRRVRGESFDVYVLDVKTKRVRRLTDAGSYEWAPTWSPDGQRLAISRTDDVTTSIVLISTERGEQRRLTQPPKRSRDGDPSWSPDGTQIAFGRSLVRGIEGEIIAQNIYVVDAAGGRPERITPNKDFAGGGTWSPDGVQIAYGCRYSPAKYGVCIVSVDGTERRRLTSSGDDGFPVWSPDGTTIAFVSRRDPPGFGQVYAMDADGSDQRRVSQTGTSDEWPVWLQ